MGQLSSGVDSGVLDYQSPDSSPAPSVTSAGDPYRLLTDFMPRLFTSLRAALLVPFVIVIALVAGTISLLSYQTGLKAVDELSERLLLDLSNRVGQATTRQLASSSVMLNVLAPPLGKSDTDPASGKLLPTTLSEFEQRMWIACNLYRDERAYLYYGTQTGEFVGLQRDSQGQFEIRIRGQNATSRTAYETTAPGVRGRTIRSDNYDPRVRPWYLMASEKRALTWSSVYVDFTTKALTVTLAKPVFAADGSQSGVIATDMPLTALAEFVRGLQVSQTGVAFIVEKNGALIATSTQEKLFGESAQQPSRLRADQSVNPLVRDAYAQLVSGDSANKSLVRGVEITHHSFDNDGGRIHMSATAQRDAAGLDWTMVVAIPRADLMGNVQKTITQNIVIGAIAVALALALGLWFMNRISGDVSRLTDATRRLARGERTERLFSGRKDELGVIATAVEDFKDGLLVDPLTGALTRSTFEKRFATRIQLADQHFALIFIDLDQFKHVNDRHGHAIGDVVLTVAAQRIAASLRADDVLARYGGDEFVVLMSNISTESTLADQITRLSAMLDEPMMIEGNSMRTGGSCGGALYPMEGVTLDLLIQVADARMYEHKRLRAEERA